jgi:hypothetical protein
MKSITTGLIAASLALAASLPGLAEDGAKGLFFRQLDQPANKLNTGLQYWIELHRGKTVERVNNKTAFKSGDGIQFHVIPNVDGYAYIVLRNGNGGEQEVLFPDKKLQEDNKVTAGHEYVLPGDGQLEFDKNPGTEKLTLVLSRTPIDSSAYLGDSSKPVEAQLVASTFSGSKDLIPTQILVSYNDVKHIEPPKPEVTDSAATQKTVTQKVQTQKVVLEHKHAAPVVKVKPKIAHVTHSVTPAGDPGVVTVVYKDPAGILAVDVSLLHQ